MKRNILISSAGKRVELFKEFKHELFDGKVVAVDFNPYMSPVCQLADLSFEVPKVTDPKYTEILLEICVNNNIKIVIPTIDTELTVLANARHQFKANDIEILVSDSDFITICRDKRLTNNYFKAINVFTPKEINKFDPIFPMFAKPYDGSLSTNIHIIKNQNDLTPEILNDEKLMFMEYIDKKEYKEYTVDMYYDASGCVKSIVPRERIEIRSGEINKGATRKNYLVNFIYERMGYIKGVRGCICLQLFYRERDNKVLGIEINPRFGGGYPLSYYAGANFPKMIIEEYIKGTPIAYSDDWKNNTIMLRYDSQVIKFE